MVPRQIKALGCMVVAQGWNLASALGNTPQYSRQKCMASCTAENLDRNYRNRNIYILSESQATIKALDNYQINCKLPSIPRETGWT
jgi:hypothetical protein